jgi:hypothetical protein
MITDDIKPEWLPVVDHIKKQCVQNRGFASVNLAIPIFGPNPVPVNGEHPEKSPGPGWLSIIRHLQAKCSKNSGLSIARIRLVVVQDAPVLWQEAVLVPLGVEVGVSRIRPMRVQGLQKAPDLIAAVSCFLPGVLDGA